VLVGRHNFSMMRIGAACNALAVSRHYSNPLNFKAEEGAQRRLPTTKLLSDAQQLYATASPGRGNAVLISACVTDRST